jgi:hypothetical protein
MYVARKNVLENREITLILKGEMSFATETSLSIGKVLPHEPQIAQPAPSKRQRIPEASDGPGTNLCTLERNGDERRIVPRN